MKNRSLLAAALASCAVLVVQPGCSSGASATNTGADAGASSEGGAKSGIGDPCTPTQENDPTFLGFNETEVNVETVAPDCATRVCLTNHFRGRVSCPYGQSADGAPPIGAPACKTPNNGAAVTGSPADTHLKAQVAPQCVDRAAAKAVYCSCRCANALGKTDDGATYCGCPSGFECSNLVTPIGPSTDAIAGSYCIKAGTAYDRGTACSQGCDPATQKCP